jgi:hypothetical protein
MRFSHSVSVFFGVGLLLASSLAHAQDSTTGAVRGVIKDRATGEPVVGATVVATSTALQGTQTNITDGDGSYYLPNLPPGTYTLTVYHLDAQFSRKNVLVQLGKAARVNISIDLKADAGEVIEVEGNAPIIDQASTKTGTTITQDFTDNVPSQRTFGDVLGAAAGSQGDLYGVSFGGSTSAENVYIVDGVNTTDPGLGLLTTNLPNEFIRETEVITGGYKAEYGRSTGGIVNVITKQGSNDFHGSVFGYWTPGALVATAEPTPRAGSSIDRRDHLANSFDMGAELGGPLIKDRLWFHAGFNPAFQDTSVARIIRSQTDVNQTGVPDVDQNGFTKFGPELGRRTLTDTQESYYYTAKLTGAINPDHQGTLSVVGNPSTHHNIFSVVGEDAAGQRDIDRNIFDVALKWTSKFNDAKSQIDVVAGTHKDIYNERPTYAGGTGTQVRYDVARPLADFAGQEQDPIPPACIDGGPNDPYPKITKCPVQFYRVGGYGYLENTDATRLTGKIDFTERAKGLGHHTFKGGLDVEQQGYMSNKKYSGGQLIQQLPTQWRETSYFAVNDMGNTPCGSFDATGEGMPTARCSQTAALTASTTTRNLSAYAQDDWAILPNLILNLGVRWEQQQVFAADEIAGKISPLSGEPIPSNPFNLSNMIAPRVGAIYDPTQEGRSRIYGSWGRFYESVPMDINVRAYGGEIMNVKSLRTTACQGAPGAAAAPDGCDQSKVRSDQLLGSGEEMVTPNLKAQYLDEMILGGEYEILPNFKLGAAYIRRDLGRIIEDMSNDGGTTYIIANPSELDSKGIAQKRAEAAQIRQRMDDPGMQQQFHCAGAPSPATCMMNRAAFRDFQAQQFSRVGEFDKPSRTYDALQITAERRFSTNFLMHASYTYSKLRGNYPGLFSPETGQLDPNLTSMYDLPELMANRYGNLAADRPHMVKVDGFYRLQAGNVGTFTLGASARGSSGIPHNVLGAHITYGESESYILPRGSTVQLDDGRVVGRSPFTTRFDAHVAYGRDLGKGMFLEAFLDVFNVFNQQATINTDDEYTINEVNPIVGGDSQDLKHAKVLAGPNGQSTNTLITRNPNYGNVSVRESPLSGRFGMRLRF